MGSFFFDNPENEDDLSDREAATEKEMDRLFNQADTDVTQVYGGYAPMIDQLIPDYVYEDERAYLPERSQMAQASGDPAAVREALRMLQGVARGGGMSEADRAMGNAVQRQQDQIARSQREAILPPAQARGMGGSGLSLLSAQQAGEASSGRALDFRAQQLAAAQQRALQGMQAYGSLGAQHYGESFAQDAQRRGAIDSFNAWRADQQRGAAQRNTERRNQLADRTVGAYQQRYEDRYRRAQDAADRTYGYGRSLADERRYQQEREDRRTEKIMDTGTSLVGTGMGGGYG